MPRTAHNIKGHVVRWICVLTRVKLPETCGCSQADTVGEVQRSCGLTSPCGPRRTLCVVLIQIRVHPQKRTEL